MNFLDKAKDLAQQARDKAGPSAAKGLDAAKSRIDKATGGKYHDQIENVTSKVESVLDPSKETPGQGGTPGSSGSSGSPGSSSKNDGKPEGRDSDGPTSSGPSSA